MKDVIFDLGKVLVDWDPRNLFVGHLGMPAAEAERFLTDVCSPDWHIEFDRGRRFEDGVALLLDTHAAHSELIETYVSHWPHMFAGPIESTVTYLNALHERGIRIHALSNYPPQQIRFLYERFDFMRLFHTVVISGLLEVAKPDPEIFERALTDINADGCIFIDDREENVAAAEAAGIAAIHFTPDEGPDRLAQLLASI
jgi:2-haloacid dehalogenase